MLSKLEDRFWVRSMGIAIPKVIYPGIYGELGVVNQTRFGHQIHDYEKLSVKINKEMLIFFFRFYILNFTE
ncbi:hypothetical protein ASL19_06675 [Cylindrospermopsis sp. CR12]|jgi:hypothetical protein|uniref:hypothetical protein n=1 Tax=Cylindrospermopsis raciborskii TaxID=77022 RepID=UPI00070D6FE8|nr:hypothetical protein [Cylindrospermopsis raciborskii]KRH96628.1 hypothetical protein ASL19_06675 [Cylindrospermopsis sp. CR12]TPX27850.1 hypothetical protein FIV49_06155 [Cylindrospermopsis raciborskii GIHE 2018]